MSLLLNTVHREHIMARLTYTLGLRRFVNGNVN